jgi:hypothetical protein
MRTKEEREHLDREFARLDRLPNVTKLTEIDMESRQEQEERNTQYIRQLESLVGGMQQSIANYQGTTSAEILNLKENMIDLKKAMRDQTELIRETYSRVTNGLEDRTAKAEHDIVMLQQGTVSEKDLNSTAVAIRGEIERMDRTYKWLIGIVSTVNIGAVGALSALVLL